MDKYPKLRTIRPDEKWSEKSEDGGVRLKAALYFESGFRDDRILMPPALTFALACNEICCERGLGKVSYFARLKRVRILNVVLGILCCSTYQQLRWTREGTLSSSPCF